MIILPANKENQSINYICMNSMLSSIMPKTINLREITDLDKKKSAFKYVVQHTHDYGIGPLEYCGIASLIYRQGAGKKHPMWALLLSTSTLFQEAY